MNVRGKTPSKALVPARFRGMMPLMPVVPGKESMLIQRVFVAVCVVCSWSLSASAADRAMDVGKVKVAMAEWTKEGLQPVKVPGLDLVYVNADARLNGYRKVVLGKVEVSVDRGWKSSGYALGTSTTGNLKPIMADAEVMVREELAKALEGSEFGTVDHPAADTVRVDVEILDLYLVALESGRARGRGSIGNSLGRVALRVSLVDSSSGELILRVFDREEGPEPRLASTRAAEEAKAWLRTTVNGWAEFMHEGLKLSNREK